MCACVCVWGGGVTLSLGGVSCVLHHTKPHRWNIPKASPPCLKRPSSLTRYESSSSPPPSLTTIHSAEELVEFRSCVCRHTPDPPSLSPSLSLSLCLSLFLSLCFSLWQHHHCTHRRAQTSSTTKQPPPPPHTHTPHIHTPHIHTHTAQTSSCN